MFRNQQYSTPDRRCSEPGWHSIEASAVEHLSGVTALIHSESFRQVLTQVKAVAATNVAVLINGESGTGKELVARAVHQYSPWSHKPLVDVSCAALPEHLAESELFGYEKGAFSGAQGSKPGFFEMANGTSLFLDEVGELDLKMQAKLLRVLDGTPYFRLGGTRKINVQARIIAATNQNLEEMVIRGQFRRDLYHRLMQFQVIVPALRERREDIPALAEFFLESCQANTRFSPEAMAAMMRYHWPGNVRELRNAVLKCSVLVRDRMIEPTDLPSGIRPTAAVTTPTGTLEHVRKAMILQALAQSGGHQQRAAVSLGISSRTLARHLKQYRVTLPMEENLAA